MKSKNLIFYLVCSLLVAAIAFVLSVTNSLEKLEFRSYDLLLKFKKDPPASDKIVQINIDDGSINQLGDWPWTRDIFADTLIRMKELGAASAVFDIEYISPAPLAVPKNIKNTISSKIYETELLTNDLVRSFPQVVDAGYSNSEIHDFADQLINDYLYPTYSDLYDYIDTHATQNNDELFGQAVQFFENTWLTVNNLDLGYHNITQEDVDYIRNRMLNYSIEDEQNFVYIDNEYTFRDTYDGKDKGFTPALHTLIKRAKGVGFTNSNVDSDGTRRRMELLYEYNGKYLGQLVFAPLLDILDSKELVRTKNKLIVKNAKDFATGGRKDITIPLDEHGRMLINWQHEKDSENSDNWFGFNYTAVSSIYHLKLLEENIIRNFELILDSNPSDSANYFIFYDDEGYALPYVAEINELVNFYNFCDSYKEHLLSKCTGYDIDGNPIDGITSDQYAEYFDLRNQFFQRAAEFCDKKYIDQIIARDSFYNDVQKKNTIDVFNQITENIESYNENFKLLKNGLDGKYCVVGMTAASTTDIGATPFTKQYANVGIHSNIMNTILTESFITVYPWYIAFAVSFIVSLLLGIILCKSSNSIHNLVGSGVRILVMLAFGILFVVFDIYIPMVLNVVFFLLIDFFAGLIFRYLSSSKEKRYITAIASSFANKDTVEQLRKNPELFNTKGLKKHITVLFSDVQKFSTLSEKLGKIYGDEAPNKLVEILNEYLGDMSNEILKNNGNIDKYEGDAIISMFGAPDPGNLYEKDGWAYQCLDAAVKMKKCEEEFNKTHSYLFEPVEVQTANGGTEIVQLAPLQTRIGINSGEAYVGLMGSKTATFSKLNYTMMGDTVNLASRLEGANKAYKSWIMCSDATWDLANSGVNEGKLVARKLDKIRVVGRSTPVQLYNILGFTNEMTIAQREEIEIFHAGLEKYEKRDFVNAGKLFMQANSIGDGDPTAFIFAERCKYYIENGVPDNWDGVMNLTEK
ncbi:MAG: CHASE2 domain-containing protein [Treponema sp.]|nr:CHASE2 domain-containing protein [Treponema sp.]